MATTTFPPCPNAITDQMLSDLHEGLLASTEAVRLRMHIATCASCRQRTEGFATSAQALRTQRVPLLQERIWQGMQRQAQATRRPGVPQWGRLAIGAFTAALVVVLAVLVVQHGHNGQSGTSQSMIPSGTPTVGTPAPHIITADTAWGAANTHALSIDATKYNIQGLLPDGAGVIGTTQLVETSTSFQPVSIVEITYPGGMVHTLYTINDAAFASVATDGRYLAFGGGQNPTGGPGNNHETLGYIDLTNGHVVTLYDAGINATDLSAGNRFQLDSLVVTHGHLFIKHATGPQGISDFDLANGTQRLLLPQISPESRFVVSWPYMLVTSDEIDQTKQDHFSGTLVDLTTMRTTDVSQYIAGQPRAGYAAAIDGTTLFTVQEDTTKHLMHYLATDLSASSPHPEVLFTLPETTAVSFQASASVADDRLLLVNDPNGVPYIWDFKQKRLINFPSLSSSLSVSADVLLGNGVIAYWQVHNGTPEMVLRVDATLPIAPAT